MFPISAKKCKIFFGIFALKFCEFRRFFLRPKPAFLFPAKNRRQLRIMALRSGMSHKSQRKLAELRQRTFFFLEINIKSEKKMPSSAQWPFFLFEITLKPDKKDEKIFGIFTNVEFRTFALFPAFSQEVKT